MPTFANIALSEPAASTVTALLKTVTQDVNGSTVHLEVQSIGDPDSTDALAAVINTAPESTRYGLVVRIASGPSSAADLPVRINAPSTANAANYLPVRLADGSTYITLGGDYTDGSTTSTLAGPSITYNNSTNNTMRQVGVTQPFPVQMRTGTLSLLSTTVVITSTNSTHRYQVLSSAATQYKVYAYFIGSTHTNPSTLIFQSSGLTNQAGADRWGANFGSGSSGITGANLAIAPPGALFQTDANEALTVMVQGGSSAASTVVVRVSISYFVE